MGWTTNLLLRMSAHRREHDLRVSVIEETDCL